MDSDLDFTGAIIRVVEDRKIVQSEMKKTVTFNNSKMYAPCGQGISFLFDMPNSPRFTNLLVYNSRFEDIVELFHIESPGMVDIYKNVFIRAEGLTDVGHVAHIIDYELGSFDQSFFRFQFNYLNASSGIWLDNVYGVTLSNNTFEDCQDIGGIYMLGGETDDIHIENSIFNNCKAGVYTTSNMAYFAASKNVMHNVETAFDLKFVGDLELIGNELTNNNIAETKFLFSLGGNSYTANQNILQNVQTAFDVGDISFDLGNNGGYFIANKNIMQNVETVFDANIVEHFYVINNELTNDNIAGDKFLVSNGGNSYITSNIIDDSHVSGSKSAFSIHGQGNVIAQFNNYNATKGAYMFDVSGKSKLYATDNISTGGRVYLQGIDEVDLYGNEINALGHKFSFRSDMSNGRFCNNMGVNASKVFSFRGNCMNTDFTNNEIGQPFTIATGTGLFVDDVIGQQEHKANLWNAVFSTEGATNTSIDVELSIITVNSDPNQGGNPLFLPQNDSFSPSNWFQKDYSSTNFANCQTSNFTTSGGSGDQITKVDREVIRGTYNTTPLSNWLAARNVIRKLTTHPSLLNDVEANTWYQAQQGTAVNTIAAIEDALAIYYGTPEEVEDIHILLDDYAMHIDALSVLNPGDSGYQDLLDDIEQVKDDLYAIQSTIDIRQFTIISQVNSLLSSMNSINDFESLFEDIYAIYVKYLQDDEYNLTSNEIDIMVEAANLCPLTYGPSIYVSRSIADYYKISYNEENCNDIRTRSSKKDDTQIDYFSVYPNPTTNILNVRSDTEVSGIRIYDTHMNIVLVTDESSVDVGTLKAGIYICEAYRDNEILGRQKVVVLK